MRSTHSSDELPLQYWFIIVVSCVVFFGLVAMFLNQGNPGLSFSAQLFGPQSLQSGQTVGFRAAGFNEIEHKPVEIRILQATLEGPDGAPLVGGPCPGNRSDDPAQICFPALPWKSGQGKVTLLIQGNGDQQLSVSATLPILAAPPALRMLPEQLATAQDNPVAVGVVSASSVPVPSGEALLWLRLALRSGDPLAGAKVSWKAGTSDQDAGQWKEIGPTGPTGLLAFRMPLRGLGDRLFLSIWPDPTTEVTWEQEIASEGMLELTATEEAQTPGHWNVSVRSATLSQKVYCSLFVDGVPQAFYRADTQDYQASLTLEAPLEGLHWLACGNQPVGGDSWAASTPLVSRPHRPAMLQTMVELALQTDPGFALARTADLSLPERELLTDYLLTRLAIPALSMGQLDNTYESQLEAAKKEVQENRTMLLIAMGLVGLGLISWAFTVVFRQLKRDQRNLDAVTRDEDEESRQPGSERRLLWSLLGVVIPAILNVVGIIFLMSLLFG